MRHDIRLITRLINADSLGSPSIQGNDFWFVRMKIHDNTWCHPTQGFVHDFAYEGTWFLRQSLLKDTTNIDVRKLLSLLELTLDHCLHKPLVPFKISIVAVFIAI